MNFAFLNPIMRILPFLSRTSLADDSLGFITVCDTFQLIVETFVQANLMFVLIFIESTNSSRVTENIVIVLFTLCTCENNNKRNFIRIINDHVLFLQLTMFHFTLLTHCRINFKLQVSLVKFRRKQYHTLQDSDY